MHISQIVGTEIQICTIKFFRIRTCVNYFQYKIQKLKMIIMPVYFVVCSAKIITQSSLHSSWVWYTEWVTCVSWVIFAGNSRGLNLWVILVGQTRESNSSVKIQGHSRQICCKEAVLLLSHMVMHHKASSVKRYNH